MALDDFGARWRQTEQEAGLAPSLWARLPAGEFPFLSHQEADFLREIGLPQTNPGFSFNEIESGMPRVDQIVGPRDEKLWARIGRDNIAPYRMLGQDGGGNPLALHIETRDIWLLDHEANFAPFDFVNSGLLELAESLLLFERAQSQEAESETDVLHKQLLSIDARAAQEGTFWHEYVVCFNDFL